jgi:predicted GIY-YIG superfamily endonuclease
MDVWLYILRCADGSYYTGTCRQGLEARVAQHDAGHFGGYTASRRPVTLVFSQPFQAITDAIAAERQVKGWTRAKKEALIAGKFDLLPELARRRTPFAPGDASS